MKRACQALACVLSPVRGVLGSESSDVDWLLENNNGDEQVHVYVGAPVEGGVEGGGIEGGDGEETDAGTAHYKRMTMLRETIQNHEGLKTAFEDWEESLALPDCSVRQHSLDTALNNVIDAKDVNEGFKQVFSLLPDMLVDMRSGALEAQEVKLMASVAERCQAIESAHAEAVSEGIQPTESPKLIDLLHPFYAQSKSCMERCPNGTTKNALAKRLAGIAQYQEATANSQRLKALSDVCLQIGTAIPSPEQWAMLDTAVIDCRGLESKGAPTIAFFQAPYDKIISGNYSSWETMTTTQIGILTALHKIIKSDFPDHAKAVLEFAALTSDTNHKMTAFVALGANHEERLKDKTGEEKVSGIIYPPPSSPPPPPSLPLGLHPFPLAPF